MSCVKEEDELPDDTASFDVCVKEEDLPDILPGNTDPVDVCAKEEGLPDERPGNTDAVDVCVKEEDLPDEQPGNTDSVDAQTTTHPFEEKYLSFTPDKWQLKYREPQPPSPVEDTACMLVDTISSLNDMVTKLKEVKEIGLGMQISSRVTYRPTCYLLQISTRTQNYIIDCLALKYEVKVLNEVFTDDRILKVMYRNLSDLLVLQDRLGLFVVNFFDMWIAANLCSQGKGGRSYAYLLKKHCDVEISWLPKEERDWTSRPLPEELINYACNRVHYLLYIFDCQSNQLLNQGLLRQLYDQSTKECRLAWFAVRDHHRQGSYLNYLRLCKSISSKEKDSLSPVQLECFRLLYEWAHGIAKLDDKNMNYILSATDMFKLAKELPRDAGRIAECFADGGTPTSVAENIEDVLQVILKTIDKVSNAAVYLEEEVWKSIPLRDRNINLFRPYNNNQYRTMYNLYSKIFGVLNPQQIQCFRLLHDWSYKAVKEKPGLVGFPFKDLGSIAKELPLDIEVIAHCCAGGVLPPLVEEHLQEVHDIIHLAVKNVSDTTISTANMNKKQKMMHNSHNLHTEDSYLRVYEISRRIDGVLNPQQLECFRLLYNWSKEIATANNRTQSFTLPLKDLGKIAKVLPKDIQGIAQCCMREELPPLIEPHIDEGLKLILQAIETVTETTVTDECYKKWQPPEQPKKNNKRNKWKKKKRGLEQQPQAADEPCTVTKKEKYSKIPYNIF